MALLVVSVVLLAAGVVVFQLAFSTNLATIGQTAADAAALAGEIEVQHELDTPHIGPSGQILPPVIDDAAVAQAAAKYAGLNQGRLLSAQVIPSSSGYDVLVTVQTTGTLPGGGIDGGVPAIDKARASIDPAASSSPPVPAPYDASSSSSPPFVAHGGTYGFFPVPGADYTAGNEPNIARHLDTLGKTLHLRVIGLVGYSSSAAATATLGALDPHTCGDASTTGGLNNVSNQTLNRFGLARVSPADPNASKEITLEGSSGFQCAGSAAAGASSNSGQFGNSAVHLVPLNGGPQLSTLGWSTAYVPPDLSQLQMGCLFYTVGQSLHVNAEVMLTALVAGYDESDMGANPAMNAGSGGSYGVLQQTPPWWGTLQQVENPLYAITGFLEGVPGASMGAIAINRAQPGLPPWELAQAVQHSGAGQSSDGLDNYGTQTNMNEARTMLSEIQSGACSKVGG